MIHGNELEVNAIKKGAEAPFLTVFVIGGRYPANEQPTLPSHIVRHSTLLRLHLYAFA